MSPNRLMVISVLMVAACGSDVSSIDSTAINHKPNTLYVASTRVWKVGFIPVCWENPGDATDIERTWVQTAVTNSWQLVAAVDFIGWGPCAAGSPGVHIRIADEGPHVLALGNQLDGRTSGMTLNFTYKKWSPGCQTQREFCSRAIAVHEFGHALGFAHEQNRPDTPDTCKDAPQGENGDLTLGGWDLGSVMNYCNPVWNNDGRLSAGDVSGVVRMYGAAMQKARLWRAEFGYIAGGWRTDQHPRLLADVNGDGRADVVGFGNGGVSVSLSTGTSFTPSALWRDEFGYGAGDWRTDRHPRLLADVNGDGRADVVGFGNGGVSVSLSTGTSFTPSALWRDEFGYIAGGWRTDQHPRFLADVNGDGRADVVGFGNGGVSVSLSTGTGFAPPALWRDEFGYGAGGWRADRHPRFLADVNGDGRADVVGFGNGGVSVSLSTGTSFTPSALWRDEFGYIAGGWRIDQHPRFLADVNGDGRADVVGFGNGGVSVSLSTGTGFAPPALWRDEFGYGAGGWRTDQHPRLLADIDGDGRQDIIGFANAGILQSSSSGAAFTQSAIRVRDLGYDAGGWRVEHHPRLVGDVNGDGRADVVGFADAGVVVSLSN